jgi:anti-sigma regulatory factor (Ser/Thr protein kinase)
MAERDHVLTVDVPDGGLLVKVDAERMTQVFGNILSNAAKHSSRGGHVHVGASANEDQVVITVTDSGDGIAPEFIGQIFEPFVQGEQGLERKRGGLGVGLSIARKLVRAHRGELHVESPGVGKGSRFTVSLPRESTPSTSDTSPPPPSTPGGSGRRILLIDDNDDFVEALASFLQGLGHQTMNACDGPTGIAAASHFLPELVFLDIGLPGAS